MLGPTLKGTYCGSEERLQGQEALLHRDQDPEFVYAQFDHVRLKKVEEKPFNEENSLGLGWHIFLTSEFEIRDLKEW